MNVYTYKGCVSPVVLAMKKRILNRYEPGAAQLRPIAFLISLKPRSQNVSGVTYPLQPLASFPPLPSSFPPLHFWS
jgi:hypothetical protein